MRHLFVVCAVGLLLMGCGVKGDLEPPPSQSEEQNR